MLPTLTYLGPEIALLILACLTLMVDVFNQGKKPLVTYFLAQLSLVCAFFMLFKLPMNETISVFNGQFRIDFFAIVLKAFILTFSFAGFLYARDYNLVRGIPLGEFYVLGLFSILGMLVLVSSQNFIVLYLGLELFSLPLYAMVALSRENSVTTEAAIKYFIMGAIASGLLLYGMSLIYGATQSLDFETIRRLIAAGGTFNDVFVVGLGFIVAALAFKFGAVPFHMWLPDVYQGAPTSAVVLIGGVSKLAGFALIVRLLVDGMPALHLEWQALLTVLAILSIAFGNIVAIAQRNLKRLLAYSAIGHAGFILLGILTGTKAGIAASLFYTITYSLMALGAFGFILLLSKAGMEAENLSDFKGLGNRSPQLAVIALLLFFSLAGVPPTVGFFAKFSVLKALIDIKLFYLAIFAVVFSVIAAFYYLRVIKIMFFDEAEKTDLNLTPSKDTLVFAHLNALFVLFFGLFPGFILDIAAKAAGQF